MFVVRFENGKYFRFGKTMDRHTLERATGYTVPSGDGTSPYEQEVRSGYLSHVESWQTDDLNLARVFETEKSAIISGSKGPFKFDVVPVNITLS